LHRFDTDQECDGRTNKQTPRPWLRRGARHFAIARKNTKRRKFYDSGTQCSILVIEKTRLS